MVLLTSGATVMWGLTNIAATIMIMEAIHPYYLIQVAICWIMIPFLIMKIRLAYILNIIFWIIFYISDTAIQSSYMPGSEWWTFSAPWAFPYLVGYLLGLANIYFSYKSYMELK
jgi:hypothetical protein